MRRPAINFTKALLPFIFTFLFIAPSSFANNTPNPIEDPVQSRYAILVAELIASPKKENYKKLKEIGDVYYVIQSPGYKVYVGSYGNYASAQPILRSLQNEYGYRNAKIEGLSDQDRTNLLWRKGDQSDEPSSYDVLTSKGIPTLPNKQDLQTVIRVYDYKNGAWATSNAALKITTPKTGIYNEKNKALVFDQDLTQRIYLDVNYDDHQINPMDVTVRVSFGNETSKLVYNKQENSFEFNGRSLKSLPTQFSYQMVSPKYGIQTDVSIPLRWVNVSLEEELATEDEPSSYGFKYKLNSYAQRTKFTPKGGDALEYNLLPDEEEEEAEPTSYGARIKKKRFDDEAQVPSGYYIQIAALGRKPDLQKFADLSKYNDVLYTYERSMYKILVGGFDDKSEAQTALKRIKKSYKKAYIIEVGDVKEGGVRDDFIPKGYTERSVESEDDEPTSYSFSSSKTLKKQYIVKLAAYSDPDYFDDTEIKKMGTCWEIKKGRLTVKYITLSGLKTPYQANAALRDIRQAGFSEAFLMTKDDKGRLVRVD